jgi:uncharacterized protein
MSKLIAQMRTEFTAAMKSGDALRRDTLRTIVGEVEAVAIRQNKPATDEMAFGVIRKTIEGNVESLGHLPKTDPRHDKLTQENFILAAYLPVMLTLDQVLIALTDAKQDIIDAKSDGQATGVAMKVLKTKQLAVDGNTVTQAVKQIRTS